MITSVQSSGVGQTVQQGTAPASGKIDKLNAAGVKNQQNAAIVKATMEVSITAKNHTMQLLLTSVISNLNEALKPDLGVNAIQNATSQDNTPEGTATRIADLSTAMFSAFKDQHPGMDQATAVDRFMATIGKGIEQGFKEARDILKGLNVLQGDIASNIDKTYELVQQKLADFRSSLLPANTAGGSSVTASSSSNSAATTDSATVTTMT